MSHIVKCRWCGVSFDTEKLDDKKWMVNGERAYYHTDCWEEKQKPGTIRPQQNNDEEDFIKWRDSIIDFIARDLKGEYNVSRIVSQMKQYKLKNKDWTYKGMFFAIKWFYEIKKNDWSKANGAIGILPYIYYDGTEYWREQERKNKGIVLAIEKQMKEMAERKPIILVRKKKEKKKNKATWSLDDIKMEENNE